MRKKKTKPAILRVRRISLTDRDRLGEQVIPDKKKKNSKRKCRRPIKEDE